MRILIQPQRFLLCALALGVALPAALQGVTIPKGPVHVRSVVRASASGKLVRTVVVTPKLVTPGVETPRAGDSVPATSAIPDSALTIPELVRSTAKKYEVDPLLVHSVIQVESNYNPYAVSPKGAQGIMQLMPGTARRFGVSNTFDPKENIEGGVRYLKYLQTLFPNDLRLAIAAYNAGEGAVWKHNNQIPPYPETEQYVHRVGLRYGQAKKQAPVVTEPPQLTASAAQPEKSEPAAPPPPSYSPVRYSYDASGNIYLRTEPEGGIRTQ